MPQCTSVLWASILQCLPGWSLRMGTTCPLLSRSPAPGARLSSCTGLNVHCLQQELMLWRLKVRFTGGRAGPGCPQSQLLVLCLPTPTAQCRPLLPAVFPAVASLRLQGPLFPPASNCPILPALQGLGQMPLPLDNLSPAS